MCLFCIVQVTIDFARTSMLYICYYSNYIQPARRHLFHPCYTINETSLIASWLVTQSLISRDHYDFVSLPCSPPSPQRNSRAKTRRHRGDSRVRFPEKGCVTKPDAHIYPTAVLTHPSLSLCSLFFFVSFSGNVIVVCSTLSFGLSARMF